MRFLQHFREALVAFDITRPPLLVSDADHLQVEGRRVSHLRAEAAPTSSGRRAVRKFDQIESVLNEWLQLFEREVSLELNWHAMPQLTIGNGVAPTSSASWKYSKKPSPNDWK